MTSSALSPTLSHSFVVREGENSSGSVEGVLPECLFEPIWWGEATDEPHFSEQNNGSSVASPHQIGFGQYALEMRPVRVTGRPGHQGGPGFRRCLAEILRRLIGSTGC